MLTKELLKEMHSHSHHYRIDIQDGFDLNVFEEYLLYGEYEHEKRLGELVREIRGLWSDYGLYFGYGRENSTVLYVGVHGQGLKGGKLDEFFANVWELMENDASERTLDHYGHSWNLDNKSHTSILGTELRFWFDGR